MNINFKDALRSIKRTMLIEAEATAKAAAEARQERIALLKKLVYDTRIPNLNAGYRHARALGYMGGEDFEEACSVLKFARTSKQAWETALACFNQ